MNKTAYVINTIRAIRYGTHAKTASAGGGLRQLAGQAASASRQRIPIAAIKDALGQQAAPRKLIQEGIQNKARQAIPISAIREMAGATV